MVDVVAADVVVVVFVDNDVVVAVVLAVDVETSLIEKLQK